MLVVAPRSYVAVVDIMVEEFSETRHYDKYWKFLLLVIGFVLNACLVFAFSDEAH